MEFAIPSLLIGLLAAGIPIIIHLAKLRELDTVTLPTIKLLERAKAQSRSRVKLLDLLLLLVRMGIIAAAIFALAKPFVRVKGMGLSSASHLVVVLDDSLSMSVITKEGTLLSQAKEKAISRLQSLPAMSVCSVILAGYPVRTVARHLAPEDCIGLIEEVNLSDRRGDLSAAMTSAQRLMTRAAQQQRLAIVLSDFQRSETPLPSSASDVYQYIPFRADTPQGNAALLSAETTGEELSVRVLQNRKPISVKMTLDDGSVDSQTLPPGTDLTELRFGIAATTAKSFSLVLTTEGDPLERDNTLTGRLRQGTKKAVLVNGDPQASRLDDELGFVVRAMSVVLADWKRQVIDADLFSGDELDNADAVLLANVGTLAPPDVRRLRRFVDEGGCLITTAGDKVVNLPQLPLPGHLQPPQQSALRLTPTPEQPLSDIALRQRAPIKVDAGSEVLLSFSDGGAAIVTANIGEGVSTLVSLPLDDDWSDLPLFPGYLSLVKMLFTRCAVLTKWPSTSEVGTVLPVAQGSVLMPDGSIVTPDDSSFDATGRRGVYQLRSGNETVATTVLRSDISEHRLRDGPIPTSAEAENNQGNIQKKPLTLWFLGLLGALIALEGILRSKRNRI